ncbi:glycosyltransferase [Paenibacillus rubinfantis]|uniref:glycosyltransferase n=1 Tax=Paenibacillus rubinfantis TaxID=1720296 RepID=UPI00073E70BF|nr:glycosyltransferase [Paenibacillus rubinfantis]
MLTNITSIILLTYNKLEYTQACINSIRQYTPRGTYQLIVVDNNSTDGTREWLAEQTDVLTIFNEENVGFPKGCNQGIEVATGDSILLLNNDVLVTDQWLTLMNDCLYSSDDIGAVGPVTNSAYGDQEVLANYSTLEEMWDFANSYNSSSAPKWEQRLKLIGFCMLIKKEVVEKVGLLDEMFSPGMCEDSDYSVRIMQTGYKLMLCQNVFIHHFGSTSFGEMPEQRQQLWNKNRVLFEEKWGFHTAHHMQPREDLIDLMNEEDADRSLNILDVGCACGATLLKAKYKFPKSNLQGIEKNESAASIAKLVCDVIARDAEHYSYPEGYYDYILLGDVIDQLVDPEMVLKKLVASLKPGGKMIASIPNSTHYSVIYSLLKNDTLYSGGVVNRSSLHLYSLPEIQKLFLEAGFTEIRYKTVQSTMTDIEEGFVGHLSSLVNLEDNNHLKSVKYLIRASRTSESDTPQLEELLKRVGKEDSSDAISLIVGMIKNHEIDNRDIIRVIHTVSIDKQQVFNILATSFFAQGLFNDIIPLLNASLEIDSRHHDTLYNYAYVLYQIGAHDQALHYLNAIDVRDDASNQLLEIIMRALNSI